MPFTVLDVENREEIPVTPRNLAQIQAGLVEGRYGFRPGQLVNVVGEDGTIAELDPSKPELAQFLADTVAGRTAFRLATGPEVDDIAAEEEFGDRPIAAVVAGAARGLSLGISDLVAAESPAARRTLQGLRERNPGASLAGEVAGAVAPAFATGGTSLAARGAAAAPASLVARGSLALEQGVTRALGRTAAEGFGARVAQRATAEAAAGAFEGAAFGVGEVISENALSDRDLTAEALLAGAADGALLGTLGGAAIGGGLGAAGSLFGRTRALTSGPRGAATREGRRALQDLHLRATGQPLADDAADAMVRASEAPGRRGFLTDPVELAERRRRLLERAESIPPNVTDPIRVREREIALREAREISDRLEGRAPAAGGAEPPSGGLPPAPAGAGAPGAPGGGGPFRTADVPAVEQLSPVAERLGRLARTLRLGEDQARTVERLAGSREFARMATRADEVVGEAGETLRDSFNRLQDLTEDVDDFARARVKRDLFVKNIDVPLPMEGRVAAAELVDETRQLADLMESSPGVFGGGSRAAARQIREILDDFGGRVALPGDADALASQLTTAFGAEQMLVLDQVKRRLARLRRSRNSHISAEFEDLHERMRLHLEDESFYGGGARAQRDINDAITRWIANDRQFRLRFMSDTGRRKVSDPWRNREDFDLGRAQKWFGQVGTAQSKITDDIVEQQTTALEDMLGRIRQYYDLPEDVEARLRSELPDLTRRIRRETRRLRETVGARNQWDELRRSAQESLLERLLGTEKEKTATALTLGTLGGALGGAGGAIGGAAVGGLIGGPVGALLGTATGVAAGIRRALPEIAASVGMRSVSPAVLRSEAAVVQAQVRITAAAARMVRGGVSREASKRLGLTARLLTTKSAVEVYRDRVRQILEATEDPTALQDRAATAATGFEGEAPQVAGALAAQTMRALSYLRDAIPAASLPDPSYVVPPSEPRLPPPLEMASFLRRVASVESPLGVAEELAAGGGSPEAMDALDAVYPTLATMMRESVSNELRAAAEDGVSVPFARRRHIAVRLGVRADPSVGSLAMSTPLGLGTQEPGQPGAPPPRPIPTDAAERDEPASAGYDPNEATA